MAGLFEASSQEVLLFILIKPMTRKHGSPLGWSSGGLHQCLVILLAWHQAFRWLEVSPISERTLPCSGLPTELTLVLLSLARPGVGVGGKCIAEFCLRAIEHILWPWQPSPWLHPTSVFLSVGFPSWVLRHALSCQPLGTRSPFLDLQFTAWRLLTLRFKDVPPLFSKLCANDQCSSSCVFFVFFN